MRRGLVAILLASASLVPSVSRAALDVGDGSEGAYEYGASQGGCACVLAGGTDLHGDWLLASGVVVLLRRALRRRKK